MPIPYWQVRGAYSIALLVALKQAGLPYASYELNAALVRALDTVDIERRWLAGDDVFAGVLRQPPDTDLEPHMKQVAALAFQ